MCLILFSINTHPHLPLIVAANRDEFYRRPTLSAHHWQEAPHVLAGKDLEAGGTWMGITNDGRFAAVTNFRAPEKGVPNNVRSRGELVRDFLAQQEHNKTSARNYAEEIISQGHQYAGFNLLVSDGKDFIYCNNQTNEIKALTSGIYALSNHLLDTPWPKATRGRNGLGEIINHTEEKMTTAGHTELTNSLFTLLQNKQPALEGELPKTGNDKNMEKLLSSVFIESEHYGTCSSTAIIFHKKNSVYFHEKQFYSEDHKKEHSTFLYQDNLIAANQPKIKNSNNSINENLTGNSVIQITINE